MEDKKIELTDEETEHEDVILAIKEIFKERKHEPFSYEEIYMKVRKRQLSRDVMSLISEGYLDVKEGIFSVSKKGKQKFIKDLSKK